MRAKIRGILAVTGLFVGAILFAVLLAEGTLRLAGYSAPIFRVPDELLGWRLRGGIEGMHRRERVNYHRVNEEGRNDDHLMTALPREVKTVAVLGDSYVEAAEVARSSNFVSVAEDLLYRGRPTVPDGSAAGHGAYAFLNYGVTGYGTVQEYLLLRDRILKEGRPPSSVALFVFLGNDITDNIPAMSESLQRARPGISFQSDGSVRVAAPDKEVLERDCLVCRIVQRSRVAALMKEASLLRYAFSTVETSGEDTPDSSSLGDRRLYESSISNPQWQYAWELTTRLIVAMNQMLADRRIPLFVFVIPPPWAVGGDSVDRTELLQKWDIKDLSLPARLLTATLQERGVRVVDLTEHLENGMRQHKAPVFGFPPRMGQGHLNELGHRIVGRELARALFSNESGASVRKDAATRDATTRDATVSPGHH